MRTRAIPAALLVAMATACASQPRPCRDGADGVVFLGQPPMFVGVSSDCWEPMVADLRSWSDAVAGRVVYGPWLSRDGRGAIVQGSREGTSVLWYLRRDGDRWASAACLSFDGMVAGASLSIDGRFGAAVTVLEGVLRPVRVDLRSGAAQVLPAELDRDRNDVCLSSDGSRIAFVDRSHVLAVWEEQPGAGFRRVATWTVTAQDRPVCFLDDGRLAVQFGWDFVEPSFVCLLGTNGSAETVFELPQDRAPLVLSPDGATLVFRDGSLWWQGGWSYGALRRDGRERRFDGPTGYRARACWTTRR